MTHCKYCNAPLKIYGVTCEYCGVLVHMNNGPLLTPGAVIKIINATSSSIEEKAAVANAMQLLMTNDDFTIRL